MSSPTRNIIVESLIGFGETHKQNAPNAEYQRNLLRKECLEDDEPDPYEDPLKFLFGVIFDQGVKFQRAWKAPTELEKRLGHLDIVRISSMKQENLDAVMSKHPAVHRFHNKMAAWIIFASKLLPSKYKCRAEEVWGGAPTAKALRVDSGNSKV